MRLHRILSSGLALATLTFGGLWMQSRSLQRPESSDRPNRQSLLEVMERQRQQEARLLALNGEVTKLQVELAEAEQHRRAAEQQVETLEEKIRDPKILPDRFAKRLAGVPGEDGQYARLISPAGFIHAEKVVYRSHNGSQLTFKVGGRPKSYSAHEIHRVILADLGLSKAGLRDAQSRLDAEKNIRIQQANAASQARILRFASMMQQRGASEQLVAVENPAPSGGSQIRPTPEQLRELIARQRAFDERQRAVALAESAANRTVRVLGAPQGYGGGQQQPRRCPRPPR